MDAGSPVKIRLTHYRIPFPYMQQYHTQQHFGRTEALQALDSPAPLCHLLPAQGEQRQKYSPVFIHKHF